MRRFVMLFVLGAFVVASAVYFTGCKEDIIVEPPSGLRGNYSGIYEITDNAGSGTGSSTDWQYVDWTFSDQKFWCDAADTTLRDRITCDFSGGYEYDGSELMLADTIVSPGTCDHDDIAVGSFSKTVKPGNQQDTLVFTQTSGDEFDLTRKVIKLVLEE